MTPERFARLKAVLGRRQPDLAVLTDGVHKPHNVSAVLRTCDAVGVLRLHAVAASGAMRRHHMAAGGSGRWVDIEVHATIERAYQTLRRSGSKLVIAHAGPESLSYLDVDYTERIAIVLGAELHGPSRYAVEHADAAVSIPMRGMVASLNVSVAAAVILFEAERQRHAAGLYDESRLDAAEFRSTLFEWAYPEIAQRCRDRGVPYPELGTDGRLLGNPLREPAGK